MTPLRVPSAPSQQAAGPPRESVEKVGRGELAEFMGGKAKETTNEYEYECTECGAHWQNIKERGAGGKLDSWDPVG